MFRVAGIERYSIVDGEGWRYTIFFQGCKHNCEGCHNPETHSFDCGEEMTDDDILNDLADCNYARLMNITLSGGDPFFQAGKIKNLCIKLKALGYNIWAYTGFEFERFLNVKNGGQEQWVNDAMVELLNYIDVVVDGRFILARRTLDCLYRGSDNQRIIDVQASLKENKVILYKLGEQ